MASGSVEVVVVASGDTDQRLHKRVDHKKVVEVEMSPAALVYHRDDRSDLAVVLLTCNRRMTDCNSVREVVLRQLRPRQLQLQLKMFAVVEEGAGLVAVKVVD